MFLVGGMFKLFGDITGLVGSFCISNIVEYIANQTSDISNEQAILGNDKVYLPTWKDFFSNGWIVCILILISSLAQGTFSQASTHIVNMEGIKLKNAIQGLVYRKTLLLSSTCFHRRSKKSRKNFIREKDVETKADNGDDRKDEDADEFGHRQQIKDVCSINLMSDDAFNVMSFVWVAHYVWAIPLKVSG